MFPLFQTVRASANVDILNYGGGAPAIFLPQNGTGKSLAPQDILVLPQEPGMPGDFSPAFGQGSPGARVWVNLSVISPTPKRGDTLQYDGATYGIEEVLADLGGGAILHLRST